MDRAPGTEPVKSVTRKPGGTVRRSRAGPRPARQQLRAALARVVADPYEVDFAEDVRLPPPARRLIVQHWVARRRLEKEVARADGAARAALRRHRRGLTCPSCPRSRPRGGASSAGWAGVAWPRWR